MFIVCYNKAGFRAALTRSRPPQLAVTAHRCSMCGPRGVGAVHEQAQGQDLPNAASRPDRGPARCAAVQCDTWTYICSIIFYCI